MEIKTTFGGPCIYKQGFLPDGRKTGLIQDIGQGKEKIEAELLESLETGRNDCRSFINGVLGA